MCSCPGQYEINPLKCKYIDPTPVDDDSHIDDGAGWSGRLLKQKSVKGDCSII